MFSLASTAQRPDRQAALRPAGDGRCPQVRPPRRAHVMRTVSCSRSQSRSPGSSGTRPPQPPGSAGGARLPGPPPGGGLGKYSPPASARPAAFSPLAVRRGPRARSRPLSSAYRVGPGRLRRFRPSAGASRAARSVPLQPNCPTRPRLSLAVSHPTSRCTHARRTTRPRHGDTAC